MSSPTGKQLSACHRQGGCSYEVRWKPRLMVVVPRTRGLPRNAWPPHTWRGRSRGMSTWYILLSLPFCAPGSKGALPPLLAICSTWRTSLKRGRAAFAAHPV